MTQFNCPILPPSRKIWQHLSVSMFFVVCLSESINNEMIIGIIRKLKDFDYCWLLQYGLLLNFLHTHVIWWPQRFKCGNICIYSLWFFPSVFKQAAVQKCWGDVISLFFCCFLVWVGYSCGQESSKLMEMNVIILFSTAK